MPKLSVIIATYNRAQSLVRTLESLARQSAEPALWETVVVNNNSSDDTDGAFGRFAVEHPEMNLNIVFEKQQGLSHARNRGFAESKGVYIAIIDDDEEVNEGFVEAYIDFFDRYPDAAAAGGKITPLYEFTPPRWLSPIAERPIAGTLDLGPAVRLFPRSKYPGGGNMALRREMVERYGAFNPELGRTGKQLLAGEEKDLVDRLTTAGEKIYYVPGAEIMHIIPREKMTRAYFSRLSFMIGRSERVRTLGKSRAAYWGRLAAELFKWGATVILAAGYLLSGRPARGGYLFILRWNISRGLLKK